MLRNSLTQVDLQDSTAFNNPEAEESFQAVVVVLISKAYNIIPTS